MFYKILRRSYQEKKTPPHWCIKEKYVQSQHELQEMRKLFEVENKDKMFFCKKGCF